jgi:carboxylate-amine ligase
LYRTLVRKLDRTQAGADVLAVDRAVAVENKWRAQRYGVQCHFASRQGAISVAQRLDEMIAWLDEDAEALSTQDELAYCRGIVSGGTSADGQLMAAEASEGDLQAVKQWIARETSGRSAAPSSDSPPTSRAMVT